MTQATRIQAVGLDFGFTLVEHVQTPAECVTTALEQFGYKRDVALVAAAALDASELRRALADEGVDPERWHLVLRSYYRSWVRRVEPLGRREAESIADRSIQQYEAPANWQKTPYADLLLAELRARQLVVGVLSNWGPNLMQVIEHCAWRDSFDVILASTALRVGKPHPRAFAELCRALHAPANKVLYAGDDPYHDVLGARRAGLLAHALDAHDPPSRLLSAIDLQG